MIITMNAPTMEQVNRVLEKLKKQGLEGHLFNTMNKTIVTATGEMTNVSHSAFERLPGVEKVIAASTPFKLVSREFRQEKTIVNVGPVSFGGEYVPVIAGPCAVESQERLYHTATAIKNSGASLMRGGAFKPRTSPYSFQGLEEEGLELLYVVAAQVGLPVVSEITDPRDVEAFCKYIDVIQIGARNMHNYVLLKEVAKTGKPILLKRGIAATVQEWLMAAEYIIAGGNEKVILCERGIRTFETYTRNTLDLSVVPLVKQLSHLPIIVDPSHGTGHWNLVGPMAKAALAAGADGLLIEVHPEPEEALSDGQQSLTTENFAQLMGELDVVAAAVGRRICGGNRSI